MTHDPLCYQAEGKWDGGCHCDLIARIRADERKKIFSTLDVFADRRHSSDCLSLFCRGCGEDDE